MTSKLQPVGIGTIGDFHRAAGQSALEILTGQKPTLDDEIRRLVRKHGWEAVAKSAKKLAKPNKRAQPEKDDLRILGPVLEDEARRLLSGEPPRNPTTLAELAAPKVAHKQSHSSVVSRLMRRLRSGKVKRLSAIIKIEVARKEFRCLELVEACTEAESIEGAEWLAEDYFEEMNAAVKAIEAAGEKVPHNPTLDELHQIAAEARRKNQGPVDLSVLLGSHWRATDTK